jgi:hypothetical protein
MKCLELLAGRCERTNASAVALIASSECTFASALLEVAMPSITKNNSSVGRFTIAGGRFVDMA